MGSKQIAYLKLVRRQPKRTKCHEGYEVETTILCHIQQRGENGYHTLGSLPAVYMLKNKGSKTSFILPQDRALVWKELAKWMEHLLIFSHSSVVARQYENRVLWEGWERSLAARPQPKDLYQWQDDEEMLLEVRSQYEKIRDKLSSAIGPPHIDDFNQLYPNEYDDIGYSDPARRAIKEIKAVFGKNFLCD